MTEIDEKIIVTPSFINFPQIKGKGEKQMLMQDDMTTPAADDGEEKADEGVATAEEGSADQV